MNKTNCISIFLGLYFAVVCPGASVSADEVASLPFQDNPVLQQEIPLPVWGASLPGAKVTIVFDDPAKTAEADKDGKWRCDAGSDDCCEAKLGQ